MATWLLFRMAPVAPPPETDGARTVLSAKVCVWLNGVSPQSRLRLDGSETRSSLLPTT